MKVPSSLLPKPETPKYTVIIETVFLFILNIVLKSDFVYLI